MQRWAAPANHATSGPAPSRSRVMVGAFAVVGGLAEGGTENGAEKRP